MYIYECCWHLGQNKNEDLTNNDYSYSYSTDACQFRKAVLQYAILWNIRKCHEYSKKLVQGHPIYFLSYV
jgi:hypothetical protein